MFVQVIQGRTSDAAGVRRLMERWVDEIGPSASGWLGSTFGVTADGEAIGIARFESADAAQANSGSQQQSAWYEEFSKHFDGPLSFHDCDEADTFLAGGSDEAGFVQFIQGRITDAERLRRAMAGMTSMTADGFSRPDLVGGVVAFHRDEDVMTQVAYFTSEAEAREWESKAPPPDMEAAMSDWSESITDLRFSDLTDPWLYSPSS